MVSATIVCGPPGAGKSSYVRARKGANDIVLDVDELFKALTLTDSRQKPKCLLPFVLEVRDAVICLLKHGVPGPEHAWIITCGEKNELRAEMAISLRAKTIILAPAAGECRARMIKQGRSSGHVSEMAEVAERWHKQFRVLPGEAVEYAAGTGRAIGRDGWPLEA